MLKRIMINTTLISALLLGITGCDIRPEPTKVNYRKSINLLTEQEQLELITKNETNAKYPDGLKYFKFIKHPSKKLQLAAVQQDGRLIKYIKNPDKEVQLAAVRQHGPVIKFIKDADKEVQLEAIKQNPKSIRYLKDTTPELQQALIEKDPSIIKYLKNPSPEVQKLAIEKDATAIRYIENPSKELQILAVRKNSRAIKHIKNPSLEIELLAYGKVTVPFKRPDFEAADKNVLLEVIGNKIKITNKTKQFLKITSFSEYIGDAIYNIPPFSIPPEGVKVLRISEKDIEIESTKEKVLFGYALEYQVGHNKVQDLYQTKRYKLSEIE